MTVLPPPPALLWFIPYLVIPALARRRPSLVMEPAAAGPLVSVIVPARNEAHNIDRLLESLRATTYEPVEFIVVDDRSTDETARLVEAHARADSRVRLVHGVPLPPGWFGKPWACQQGAALARGDLLVFADADTTHHPALLSHAVGGFTRSGTDLLTVVTGQILVTFWERAVMPHVLVPLAARYHPGRINSATKPREVLANGQFFLTSRRAYSTIGTHEAVRSEIAEDLVIGQRFVQAGLRVRMWWAEDLIQTRMYSGLGPLIEGWSKNLYLGSKASFPNQPGLAAMAPLLVLAGQLFWLAPIIALFLTSATWPAWAIAISAGFWAIIAMGLKIPGWYGFTYPLGSSLLAFILLRSALRGTRRIDWRGRTYTVEESRGRPKPVEEG